MFVIFTLAIVLMVLDNVPTLPDIRSPFKPLVAAIERSANMPLLFASWLSDNLVLHNSLVIENKQLKEEQLVLKVELQTYNALLVENDRLRSLLNSTMEQKAKLTFANITYIDPDPFIHQFVLDKGTDEGIYVGQPVVDDRGIMGAIIGTTKTTARMLSIADASQAVPVESIRNGTRAIASGTGNLGKLTLKHIPNTTDILIGDEFVTSGIGGRYPSGYPVGVVIQVERDTSQSFAKIYLKPKADLERGRQVMLILGK